MQFRITCKLLGLVVGVVMVAAGCGGAADATTHDEVNIVLPEQVFATGPRTVSASGYDVTRLDVPDAVWQALLDGQTYDITRQAGTERAFTGTYHDHHDQGVYVSVTGGLPLFSSQDKFDSGTGWPSFTKPVDPDHVILHEDRSHGMVRTEVLDARTGSHLGHVFDDGPPPTGLRYCINSAALVFVADDAERPIATTRSFVPTIRGESRPVETTQPSTEKQPTMSNEKATFAAGCFWSPELAFSNVDGVIDTRVGYIGGEVENPTYRQVCTDTTGHAEAVEVTFDPTKVTYEQLLEKFWEVHDPTQVDRQGPDVGNQYRTAIFYHSEQQRQAAEQSKAALEASDKFNKPIATNLEPAGTFWAAEDYHQDYLRKRGYTACPSKH